ncbi:MAG: hypothetical protein EOM23_03830, partial [Candidatus Moranbacteria bacterium]|nr:hypothetical protein [Candidatus Moranbacteria bacterium]
FKLFFSEFFLPELADSLKNSFNSISNLSNQFSGEPFSIRLITDEYSVTVLQHDNELSVNAIGFQKKIVLKKVKQNRNVRKTDTLITLYYKETDDGETGFLHAYSVFISDFYYDLLKTINKLIAGIHYLPASRSGLYQALSAFGQIVAELSKSRAFLTKKIELPNISEPLSDYFLKLTEIKVNKRIFEEKPVNKIAEEIETDILRGQVEFDPKTKKIFYMPEGTNLRLDLSATSSMVSELSPIVSFLRYVITATPTSGRYFIRKKSGKIDRDKSPKHLMMIEEPEAHLHPEIQLKMTEIFSRLVGAGVKIVITTHSNYIFNKVNNLILDRRFTIGNMSSKVFKTTDKGSEGIELSADELGIEDENFIDVSEYLYNEKIELIEKLNQHD